MAMVFANNTFAVVTAGGTTTSDTSWTVSSVIGFPTSLAVGQAFHVADLAAQSEKILVTAISGSGPYTWTVTRSDEGSASVAHAAGFTVIQVVTAGDFTALDDVDWFNVKTFGAKGDGSTVDTTAIQAALTAAGAFQATQVSGGATVYVPAGVYITGPLVIPQNVMVRGAGIVATTLKLASTATQYANLLSNQQLVGTSYDADCCSVKDLTLDGNAGAMSTNWWNCGLVLSNRPPTGTFEYNDSRHQASNLLIQNFTGDGFVQIGQGQSQFHDIQVWLCNGFGFVCAGYDCFYTNCDAGASGLDGFIIANVNTFTNCKSWFSGAALTSTRASGASATTRNAPTNDWDGGNVSGGVTFSLANGYGNGFLWRGLGGTSVTSPYNGGTGTAMWAQDNARAGFSCHGGRWVLEGVLADSNSNCGVTSGTTPLASFAGIELPDGDNSQWQITGVSRDRGANTNHQPAAVYMGAGNGGTAVRVAFSGTINDGSNMPPLLAGSTSSPGTSLQFAGMGSGSLQQDGFASSYTPDPFAAEIHTMTITGAITVNAPKLSGTNTTGIFLVPGMRLVLIFTQNGGGGNAITLNGVFRLNGKSFSTTGSATTVMTFYWDGTSWQA